MYIIILIIIVIILLLLFLLLLIIIITIIIIIIIIKRYFLLDKNKLSYFQRHVTLFWREGGGRGVGVIRIFIFSSSYLTSIHIVFYQNPNWIIITKYVIVNIQQLSIWDFMMDSVPIFYEQLHSQRPFILLLWY